MSRPKDLTARVMAEIETIHYDRLMAILKRYSDGECDSLQMVIAVKNLMYHAELDIMAMDEELEKQKPA